MYTYKLKLTKYGYLLIIYKINKYDLLNYKFRIVGINKEELKSKIVIKIEEYKNIDILIIEQLQKALTQINT